MLGLVLFLKVQNLRRINQRKGHRFTQEKSDDEDDEYDSGIFTDRNAQNLHRIKQRKERCFIPAMSANGDDQNDDLFAPIASQDYSP